MVGSYFTYDPIHVKEEQKMNIATVNFLKFILVLLAIILTLHKKYSMHIAFAIAMIVTAVLWKIPVPKFFGLIWEGGTAWETISLVLIMYVITFLQRLLEDRNQLKMAQINLYRIFNNRRINATIAPILIGLLPSAAVVTICGDIVTEASRNSLNEDEKTFVTSYYRHIPESIIPTFTTILIMSNITGLSLSRFMIYTFPLAIALYFVGYFFYIKKIPKETGIPESENKLQELVDLIKHIWTIIAIIVLILSLNVKVLNACIFVTIIAYFYYGIELKKLPSYLKRGFEANIILNMFCIMIFKEILNYTGCINTMPEFFSKFPLPISLTFALIFFFGALLSGSQSIATICTAMAFESIPGSGIALMVLLHSFAYAAMQISPVHVCCAVIIEYFHTSFLGLVKKGIPVVATFCIISYCYFLFLTKVCGVH